VNRARELLVEVGAGRTRVALVEDGRLEGFWCAPRLGVTEGRVGDIYLARVTKVVTAMGAAFVDLGLARDGFLALRDAPDGVHEGQMLVVRITRGPQGAKGAKVSARVKLDAALEAHSKGARPPALLREGPGIIAIALGSVSPDTPVLIDDPRASAAAHADFPHLAITHVREDLFSRHDLEEQVASLARMRVSLACGGWITIQGTEGMTAIDVNSGSFVASGGREETARIVNLEAAHEAGRQIRLRGIGGLIVLDCIQMEGDGAGVAAALKESLGDDSRVSSRGDFGIIAVARRRGASSLPARQTCRSCEGSGQTTAPQTIALEALARVERSARAAPGRPVVVRAAPAVMAWLKENEGGVRAELDRRGVGRVRYDAEAQKNFPGEGFDVTTE
jgi:ribonuclease G